MAYHVPGFSDMFQKSDNTLAISSNVMTLNWNAALSSFMSCEEHMGDQYVTSRKMPCTRHLCEITRSIA